MLTKAASSPWRETPLDSLVRLSLGMDYRLTGLVQSRFHIAAIEDLLGGKMACRIK
jgi:hypothetical protein